MPEIASPNSNTTRDGTVINEELIELLEAGYVLEGSGGPGRTRYKITEAGRAAATQSVGE
jgi:hypothetical protein